MSDVPPVEILSATVSCIPLPDDPALITAETIDSFLPEPSHVEAVRDRFQKLGFETGSPYAGTFAISATRENFVQVFAPHDPDAFDDDWFADASESDLELTMPESVDAGDDQDAMPTLVFFTAPPDFGPTYP